jgi:hypothetical protein
MASLHLSVFLDDGHRSIATFVLLVALSLSSNLVRGQSYGHNRSSVSSLVDTERKRYRCWNPVVRHIQVSSDVNFDESYPFFSHCLHESIDFLDFGGY